MSLSAASFVSTRRPAFGQQVPASRATTSRRARPSAAVAAVVPNGPPNLVTAMGKWTIPDDKLDEFKGGALAKLSKAQEFGQNSGNFFYAASQAGNTVVVHDGWTDADAFLAHVKASADVVAAAMPMASDISVIITAPPEELAKIKDTMGEPSNVNVEFYETFEAKPINPLANYDDPLEKFCEGNPDADECRVYED